MIESLNGKPHSGVVITGGAGFVGTNLAHRLALEGERVVLLDNLSRPGVEHNLRWLQQQHGDRVILARGDVRDRFAVREALENATSVFHLAAQVAVTTSLEDPLADFSVNAQATVLLLEELRRLPQPTPLVFTSTNKVYGSLANQRFLEEASRYAPADPGIARFGISEDQPLDFHSPYGCSKGAADQYILDYARSFGIPAVVFRMSCIYGPHQFGNEDQGWVAHFLIRNLRGEPLSLYGNGKQVRDILFVEDLVEAFLKARRNAPRLAGRAFNIGGGVERTTSLLELLAWMERHQGRRPRVDFHDWRTGDQSYYVSDTRRFQEATGWRPRVSVDEGVERLNNWLRIHHPGVRSLPVEERAVG